MAKKKDKKIKILVWGDTPDCSTGFGTVIRGIFTNLAKTGKYDIDIIGINDAGDYKDPKKYPNMRIYPALPGISASRDFHGRTRFIDAILGKEQEISPPWDIVFTLNDPFILDHRIHSGGQFGTMRMLVNSQISYILQAHPSRWYKIVSYFPVDSPLKPNWIKDTMGLCDRLVAYTKYGKKEIDIANNKLIEKKAPNLDNRTSIIYHGYDKDVYKPISKKEVQEFRKGMFGDLIKDETFIISVVGRNQVRKDIPRSIKIFSEFKKRRPDSILYIHAKADDVWGNLGFYADQFGLEIGKDVFVPTDFNERLGVTRETLNMVYNMSDVLFSSNLGEGFGMTYIESMGAGTINLAPFHTTTPELFDLENTDINEDARGISYKSGSTKSEWAFYGPSDLIRERPLANVEDGVKKLVWIYENPEKVAKIEDNARKWIQNYSWEDIAKQWDVLFQDVYKELKEDRINHDKIKAEVKEKLGIKEEDANSKV